MALSRVVSEIFNVEKYRDLEIRVRSHSRSLEPTPIDPLSMISYERSIAIMALSRAGDFSRNSQNFSIPVYFAPLLKGFHLELGAALGVKNYNDGATMPRKKFEDIFSRLDTIHKRDGQTDRETVKGGSKDRAYA